MVIIENCPVCGEKMEKGYIGVMMRSSLFWSKDEPKSARFLMPEGAIQLLINSQWFMGLFNRWYNRKNWLRKGFRCPKCEIIIFHYGEEKEESTVEG